jgi:hypothetical protein
MWMRIPSAAVAAVLCVPALAWPCYGRHEATPATLVQEADAIVLAVARRGPEGRPTPRSTVHFVIQERLKGDVGPELRLPGYLTTADDFNDRLVPYDIVRPGGRQGSCYATAYKKGGTFLLLLERGANGRLTTQWAALQPVNEQIRGEDDPWLLWVRDRISRGAPRTDRPPAAGRR